MAQSYLFKQPDRKGKKYYKGKALILKMAKYDKQYNYSRRKTMLYQNAVFHSYGNEHGFISATIALAETIRETNDRDGEKIDAKHGILLLLIKEYATETGAVSFTDREVFEYYQPNVAMFVQSFGNVHSSFLTLFHDLVKMNFLNPYAGKRFAPTTRLAGFCARYNRYCNKYMPLPDPIADFLKKNSHPDKPDNESVK